MRLHASGFWAAGIGCLLIMIGIEVAKAWPFRWWGAAGLVFLMGAIRGSGAAISNDYKRVERILGFVGALLCVVLAMALAVGAYYYLYFWAMSGPRS